MFHRFSKFFYGGLINYGLKIFVTAILTEIFMVWYFISYIIALFCVVIFSYFYNAYITYNVYSSKRKFIKYIVFLILFIIADALLVKLLTEIMGLHYVYSIIGVTTGLFLLKYLVYGKFVFIE